MNASTGQAEPSAAKSMGASFASAPAAVAVSLLSWTYPRVGFLKFSEVFALLATPGALTANPAIPALIQCYWPFLAATIVSLCVAPFTIGHGDPSLSSQKGFYSSPELVPFVTLIHILAYLLTVAATSYYFSVSSQKQISRTLRWAYYLTILPGLLQIFRIYSGIYFNLPFERTGVGPFSGVYNAGYLRAMGFEFEPLAYASSLVIVCCLSMYNGRRIPWLGLIVLWHTYSAGAITGVVLAAGIAVSKRLTRAVVPLYAVAFVLIGWYIHAHIHALMGLFLLSGSVTERLGAFYACVAMWLDHPMGVGLGLYAYFFNLYDIVGLFPANRLDFYPNNDPGMFLAYGGPIFLIAYLYTFHFVLRRARSYWLLVAGMGLLFQSISSYLFFNPAIIVIFSLLLVGAEPIPRKRAFSGMRLFDLGPLRSFPWGARFFVRNRPPSIGAPAAPPPGTS